MRIDYSDTVNVHVNLPRQLVEFLDIRRDRHTTRTIQIIRAVEAYVEGLETTSVTNDPPKSEWLILRSDV